MFKFVVIVALFGMAFAVSDEFSAETKVSENTISSDGGSFHYAYQTSNGIDVNSDGNADVISGKYKYSAPDGTVVEVSYKSDETGYHADGPFIPVGPPIPAAIIRSLEWNAAHPQKEDRA